MRILHCITGLTGDGAQRVLLRLTHLLRERSFESFVVNLGPRTPLVSEFEAAQVSVTSLGASPQMLHMPYVVTSMRRILKKIEPDVIQGWMYHANVISLIASSLTKGRTPVAWNIRRGMEDYRERSRSTRAVIRLSSVLSSYVDSIVYCSSVCRSQHEAYGYDSRRGHIVYNGFDREKFHMDEQSRHEARTLFSARTNEIVIGNVGRFDVAKGHRYLVEAFARLAARVRNVRLVCVGRGMDGTNMEIRDLIARAGIADRVALLGERESVERIFPGFDVYCSASINEGFPNVIAEAMACALPCVVTNVGGSAEVVGDSGVIVPSRSGEALAEGLYRYVRLSTVERRVVGERARERVIAQFSLQAMVERYAQLYRSLKGREDISTREGPLLSGSHYNPDLAVSSGNIH